MGTNTHIIQRVNLEIDVPDMRLANRVKDDVSRLLYNDILPKLEKFLDGLKLTDEHIQINHIDIDAEHLSEENFEDEFASRVLQEFHEKTEQIVGPFFSPENQHRISDETNAVVGYSAEERALERFLFFLETGRLPWWSAQTEGALAEENLKEALIHSPDFFQERLLPLISNNPLALERLLHQFSFHFLFLNIFSAEHIQSIAESDKWTREIILLLNRLFATKQIQDDQFSPQQKSGIKTVVQQLFNPKTRPSQHQVQEMIYELSSKISVAELIDQFAPNLLFAKIDGSNVSSQAITGGDHIFQKIPKTTAITPEQSNTKPGSPTIEEDGIFLNNAGLVLLHPFFESFLGNYHLLVKGQFKNTECQMLAVHLLHYLATKTEHAPEYELTLEKFLCNWDLDEPIAREVALSHEMKAESEVLLAAAIKHWSALKSTSPNGLREGFLQRPGKLILNDFQDRLIVENQAHDVLLSYLPWSYSVIKLPWMNTILYTEWI